MGSRNNSLVRTLRQKKGMTKALYEYTLGNNIKSWIVLLVWIALNSIVALFYLLEIIGAKELICFLCSTMWQILFVGFMVSFSVLHHEESLLHKLQNFN